MNYEIIEDSETGIKIVKRTNDDGSLSFIPMDEANADYQAYLNKDTLPSNSSTPQAGA